MQTLVVSNKNINSLLIAIILCINTFSKMLSIFVIIPYNIVMMESVILILLAIMNSGKIPLTKPFLTILFIVAAVMGYSLFIRKFDSRVIERCLKFIMYAAFPMVCIQFPFEEKLLMRGILYIGIIHAVYLFGYAAPYIRAGLMDMDTTMDLSYTSLTYVFAAITILFSRREKLFLRVISLATILLFLYFLISVSTNRGALIAAFCFISMRFLMFSKSPKIRVSLFILIIACGIITFMNIVPFMEKIDELATSHGVVIQPLRKTIHQMNYNDSMTSGREKFYSAAMELIRESYAFPNGVAAFDIIKHAYYPHNLFLEVCIEMGIVGVVLAAYIILKACDQMLVHQNKYSFLILMFFCLSIPRLMISSSYWENAFIWPMMILLWQDKQRKID